MHDTRVELKDGRVFEGPIYICRLKEGYVTLILDELYYPDAPEKFYFRDCVSVVTPDERIQYGVIGDDDILARAREEGWDGT